MNSQSARDALASGFGGERYAAYLDATAERLRDFYLARGDAVSADRMMTRSLGEDLAGNDGD